LFEKNLIIVYKLVQTNMYELFQKNHDQIFLVIFSLLIADKVHHKENRKLSCHAVPG